MANKTKVAVLRGKANYAKILGDPVPNFSKDGFEWKIDLVIDKADLKECKTLGIADKVKQKDGYVDGQPYLTFKQREVRPDGGKNDPITVTDILNKPWGQQTLIGNGSTVDVKFAVIDYGPGKKAGMYIRSVRVLDLVKYQREEFTPIDESDEYYIKAKEAEAEAEAETAAREDRQFKEDFPGADLDDDMPV